MYQVGKGDGRRLIAAVNRHIFGAVSFHCPCPKNDLCTGASYFEGLLSKDGSLLVNLPPLSAMVLDCRTNPPQKRSLKRRAGVLCHISSIPSAKMDSGAKQFIDYLSDCGQKLWQILPLNPAGGEGDSPYSSPAVFAGDERLMDEDAPLDWDRYQAFCRQEAFWLEDFALYMVLKGRVFGFTLAEMASARAGSNEPGFLETAGGTAAGSNPPPSVLLLVPVGTFKDLCQ